MSTKVLKTSSVMLKAIAVSGLILAPITAFADRTDDVINTNLSRMQDGAAVQKRIDRLSEDTEKVIADYHQERKNVETLQKFNDRMRRTIQAQENAMQRLERSIEDASLIERQIVPLMISMIDGLEKFIAADIPFKLQERTERLERIRGYLTNANISAAERFRQVLEAYAIESDYGQSVDTFIEDLNINGENLTVNVLQVGRAGLYYQTVDGQESGYWDKEAREWKALDSSHNEGISHAIRMTQGKETKDLMTLPMLPPVAVGAQ